MTTPAPAPAPATVAVVPVRAMREAWRAVRDALPALSDVPWPLVDAAVMGGSEAIDLVEQCTDGDALIVCGLRAASWRWRDGTTVRVRAAVPVTPAPVEHEDEDDLDAYEDRMTNAVSDAAERRRYGVTVDGLAAGPVREALVAALVALGAEVAP